MNSARFRSRIDLTLVTRVFAPLVFAFGSIVVGASYVGTSAVVIAIVLGCVGMGFVAWFFLDASYALTATELLIRCGPVRTSVPLASIRSVRASNTVIAAPALSLHRLELDCGASGQAVISPADADGFIAALRARVPAVQVS